MTERSNETLRKDACQTAGLTMSRSRIEAARNYSVVNLWDRLGFGAVKDGGLVRSPWREDATASLQVGGGKNIVFDHGTKESLDTIALVQKVRACGFVEAVGFIVNGDGPTEVPSLAPKSFAQRAVETARRQFAELKASGNLGIETGTEANGAAKSNKWTPDQALAALRGGHERLLASTEAMTLLTAYGLERRTIECAPLALQRDAVLYTDSLEDPTVIKSKSVRRGPDGKRAGWFAYGNPALWWPCGKPRAGAEIVLTGGEEKCLLCIQEGIAACTTLNGEGTVDSEWAREIAALGPDRVTIWMDNDQTGRDSSEKWAAALWLAGVRDVRIIQWA
ncbi:MAG: toprim domain-containing protein [Candidatus Sumerlaeota bacterium]|nr:toprim domain-containing protein [Candidatus Sumerlaeota bacterium]